MQTVNNKPFYDSSDVILEPDDSIAQFKGDLGKVITENSILCKLSQRKLGFTKQVQDGDVDYGSNVDTTMLKSIKNLIDKKYLDGINACDRRIKSKLSCLAVRASFVGEGTYLIPLRTFDMVRRAINDYAREREVYIQELLDMYDGAVENARIRLNGQFNEKDYPRKDVLKSKYSVQYSYWELDVPEGLKKVDESAYQEAQAQMKRDLEGAVEEIRMGLRIGMKELVDGMYDKVSLMDTETKRFKAGFVEKVRSFLEVADAKNFINDEELKKITDQAKELLDGVSPDDLKQNYELQLEIEDGLRLMKDDLDSMIEDSSNRRMEF